MKLPAVLATAVVPLLVASSARGAGLYFSDRGVRPMARAGAYVAGSDDKQKARLNIISHLLSKIPYVEIPREEPVLPERQGPGDYVEPDYPYRHVPEKY